MTKLSPLFLLCILLSWGGVQAQNRVAPVAPGQPVNARTAALQQVHQEAGTLVGPPNASVATGIGTSSAPADLAGKTSTLNAQLISTASNAYSIISNRQNQIATNNEFDLVAFIHRQNIENFGGGVVENGIFRVDYSTNNGTTWNGDRGPLCPTPYPSGNAGRARYPQITVTNDQAATTVNQLTFGFAGPMTNGNGWGNYVWGSFDQITNLTQAGSTTLPPSVNFGFLSNTFPPARNVIIPGGMCEGQENEVWMCDQGFNPTTEEYLGYIILTKGVRQPNGTITYSIVDTLDATGYLAPETGNPSLVRINGLSDVMAFSPDGQHGWLAFTGDAIENPALPGYAGESDIILYHSSDGGDSWDGPMIIKGRNFTSITDSIFTNYSNGQTSSGIPTFYSVGITVDMNGNPHVLAQAINSSAIDHPDSLDFIEPGGFKVMVDITTSDMGQTWCAKHLGFSNAWRGNLDGGDLRYTVHERIARNETGSHIFYFWCDDTSATDATLMQPDLWGRALRISDDAMTPLVCFSNTDGTYAKKIYFPQIATVSLDNAQNFDHNLPMVFLDAPQGELNPCNFLYSPKIGFNNSQFQASPIDIAITGITTSPGPVLCAGTSMANVSVTIQNVGSTTATGFSILLNVEGPIGTNLSSTVASLAPGGSTTVNFNNVNFATSGTYVLTATVNLNGDYTCANNVFQYTVTAFGGASSQIFTPTSVSGCGSYLLDPGLQGATINWTPAPPGGNPSPTFLVTTSGSYDVTATISGCPNLTDNIQVTINPNPTNTAASVEACASAAASVVTAGPTGGGNTYSWVYSVGTPPGGASANSHTFNGAGYWAANVTITDANGCSTTNSIEVKRWNVAFNAATDLRAYEGTTQLTISSAGEVCGGSYLRASNSTLFPGAQFNWTVDGNAASTSQDVTLVSGAHAYALTVSDPIGCGSASGNRNITKWDTITLDETHIVRTFTDGSPIASTIPHNCVARFEANLPSRSNPPGGGDPLTPYTTRRFQVFPANQVGAHNSDGDAPTTASNQMTFNNASQLCIRFNGGTTGVVRYTAESGTCTKTVVMTFTLNSSACSGSNDINACTIGALEPINTTFSVYPNPSNGRFNVDLSMNRANAASLRVVDLTGRVVLTQQLGVVAEANTEVDLSNAPNGVYILMIQTEDGGLQTARIVKQ